MGLLSMQESTYCLWIRFISKTYDADIIHSVNFQPIWSLGSGVRKILIKRMVPALSVVTITSVSTISVNKIKTKHAVAINNTISHNIHKKFISTTASKSVLSSNLCRNGLWGACHIFNVFPHWLRQLSHDTGLLLLTWFNSNPNIDK